MKKLLSLIIALSLVFVMSAPSFAAEIGKGTISERIAAIEEVYGIKVTVDTSVPYHEATLTNLESALSYLGSAFTKKVATGTETAVGVPFVVAICKDENWHNSAAQYFTDARYNYNNLHLYPGNYGEPTPVFSIIHEFGHAVNKSNGEILANQIAVDIQTINGGANSYSGYVEGRYVSSYAASSYKEDQAETFMYMVLNGGTNPNTYASNTLVYQKKMAHLDWTIDVVGTGSRATQRMAEHMGIDLETYNK